MDLGEINACSPVLASSGFRRIFVLQVGCMRIMPIYCMDLYIAQHRYKSFFILSQLLVFSPPIKTVITFMYPAAHPQHMLIIFNTRDAHPHANLFLQHNSIQTH